MNDMFKFFDKICRDNGLKYWAIGGTLIGAIRHKGWIPWDGDIDVGMLEKDYENFRKIMKKVLPANMVFEHRPINKPCSKIRLLDAYYISSPFSYHWDDDDGLMLDIFIFNTNQHEIYSKFPGIDVFTSSNVDSRPYSDFFPLKQLPFEDFTIYVPSKYESITASHFGEVPPPLLPLAERYPHEGNIVYDHVTQKMKDKYELHKKLPDKGVYTEFGRVI
jgi:phosphorylcholine metabolism protein LicD